MLFGWCFFFFTFFFSLSLSLYGSPILRVGVCGFLTPDRRLRVTETPARSNGQHHDQCTGSLLQSLFAGPLLAIFAKYPLCLHLNCPCNTRRATLLRFAKDAGPKIVLSLSLEVGPSATQRDNDCTPGLSLVLLAAQFSDQQVRVHCVEPGKGFVWASCGRPRPVGGTNRQGWRPVGPWPSGQTSASGRGRASGLERG